MIFPKISPSQVYLGFSEFNLRFFIFGCVLFLRWRLYDHEKPRPRTHRVWFRFDRVLVRFCALFVGGPDAVLWAPARPLGASSLWCLERTLSTCHLRVRCRASVRVSVVLLSDLCSSLSSGRRSCFPAPIACSPAAGMLSLSSLAAALPLCSDFVLNVH